MQMRGGTSKGAYFLAEDLPASAVERDRALLAAFGSPDARQVDGIGGAHPLTSKAAIVSKSALPDCDIDFLFCQVGIDRATVDTTPNCGNILSGVAPFAIERNLVRAGKGETVVRIRTLNTGTIAELSVMTPGGVVQYDGDTRIDGVPGTAAPIAVDFLDAAGSSCGSLLPTGNIRDTVAGTDVTLIDNGMPVIVIAAQSLSISGHEPCAELAANKELRQRLEDIRLACGPRMNLGDVRERAVPKLALVSAPKAGGDICTRSFIPHDCHSAIGVFAAVTVATACVMPGSVAFDVARKNQETTRTISVEHPSGEMSVRVILGGSAQSPIVTRAGLLRTARKLADGHVYVNLA